jgi:HAD superfamily hydrolase (TIGR01509 family)
MSAMVDTLQDQTLWSGLILSLLALLMAYVMSRLITNPFIKMNDAAKQLAQGKYDVNFSGSGYREINELADHEYATSINLKPGARALLDELKRRGVKMALVTAATLPRILPCLDRNGLSGYFNLILNCDAVGLPKSDPEIYRAALRYLGGTVEDTVFFEDNVTALSTAASIGIATVGIYDDHAARHWENLKKQATVALRSFEEIGLEI